MSLASATVAREVFMEVVVPADGPQHVRVVLRYDLADPYAVSADFHVQPGYWVSWVFARDLLSQGLTAPTGEGDVRIRPSEVGEGGGVAIRLTSPDCQALVHAATSDLVEFLDRSRSLCPPGAERDHLDVDGALRTLLAT